MSEIKISNMELRDLKNALKTAKDKRIELIIHLGENVHVLLLNGEDDLSVLEGISSEIAQQDRIIYRYGKQITMLNASTQQCSKCLQQLVGNAKFCGNCGTLNPSFVDPDTEHKFCGGCTEEIDEKAAFCPCCGTKQGAV
ncbi:MAG: zinc ribbon domain-containing protein [Lysinibacillus sp.]